MEVKSLDGPSKFLDVLGDSPKNRILDFLLGEVNYDFTLKEIAMKSRVGYATIKRIWQEFVSAKIVVPTRRVGKAIFYKYNKESNNGKALRKFYLDVIFEAVENEARLKKPKKVLA